MYVIYEVTMHGGPQDGVVIKLGREAKRFPVYFADGSLYKPYPDGVFRYDPEGRWE